MSSHDFVDGRCADCGLLSQYAVRVASCPGSEPMRETAPVRPAPVSAGVVDDRSKLDETLLPNGQQKTYLVLSEAERAKGFVRPVRRAYIHVGRPAPVYPLRDLTEDERRFNEGQPIEEHFIKYEVYPDLAPGQSGARGRLWTQAELDKIGKGCRTRTTMGAALAETYAREPGFYGGTFCCGCGTHLPVGADGEFVWEDGTRVGT